MLRAIFKRVLRAKPQFVRWVNFDVIEKYAWTRGGKSYTLQLYDVDEHWLEFLPLFAKGFARSTLADRYLIDADIAKRQDFFYLYFQYKYEASFKDGRACMAGMKVHEAIGGKKQSTLIYGGIGLHDTICRDADATELMKFDRGMTEKMFERDQWLEQKVHGPMRRVAEKMGAAAWFGAHHTMDPSMRNQEIMTNYVTKVFHMACQYGLQRHTELNLPPFKSEPEMYSLLVEAAPVTDHFLKFINYEKVAHLHHNHRKECGCYLDDGVKPSDISCHIIIAPANTAQSIKKCLSDLDNERKTKPVNQRK